MTRNRQGNQASKDILEKYHTSDAGMGKKSKFIWSILIARESPTVTSYLSPRFSVNKPKKVINIL